MINLVFVSFSTVQIYDLVCWSLVVYCFQAVSDLEKGWTVGSKEAHAKLAEVKKKGDKLEVRLSHIQAMHWDSQAYWMDVIRLYTLLALWAIQLLISTCPRIKCPGCPGQSELVFSCSVLVVSRSRRKHTTRTNWLIILKVVFPHIRIILRLACTLYRGYHTQHGFKNQVVSVVLLCSWARLSQCHSPPNVIKLGCDNLFRHVTLPLMD